jgi:hypothetical protein
MRKILILCTALIALTAITACRNKDTFGYDELIIGKWEVTSFYHWNHDFTDESLSGEVTYTLPDSNYIGYDSAEFNADGTMRWHRNDRYVSGGMFTDPYVQYNWHISSDTLYIGNETGFEIKILNSENLVIENYTNNGHPEYSHHHLEQISRYTFKRAQR